MAFTGFHFHFETPLHPLIYTVLTFQNPDKISEIKTEDIEQCLEVIKLNKFEGINFLDTRKKILEIFLKNDSQFQTEYDSYLKKLWDIEMMKYKMILLSIYKGFYRKTQNKLFSMFQNEMKKSDVTTLRFWFEGINFNDDYQFEINKKMQFINNLNFKLFIRDGETELKRGKNFILLLKNWMLKSDIPTILNFLTALSGVKILLPIDNYFKPLYVASVHQQNVSHPYVIVPDQDGVIPILDSEKEIDDLVSHILNDENIVYINREAILGGLININI